MSAYDGVSQMDVSLIIPACNEEHRLPATLIEYGQAFAARWGDAFEIVVVANGCTDNTVRVAEAAASAMPQIRVINIPGKIGKGNAVMAGFRVAYGQRIAFADADGATSAASLIALIDALQHHDVVIGSRRLPESEVLVKQPAARRMYSALFGMVVRTLFHLSYRDTQCGAKAFRREAALSLAQVVSESRWVFDVDLLLCARALKLDVVERPVVWSDQKGSQLRAVSTMREVVASLSRLRHTHMAQAADNLYPKATHLRTAQRPLRILALNWRCLEHPQAGGAEINLFEQARRWARDGHTVTVLTSDPGPDATHSDEETAGGVEVIHMGARFSVYLHVAWFLLWHGRSYDRILDVSNGIPFFAPLFTSTPVTMLVHHVHTDQWLVEFPFMIGIVGKFLENHIVPFVYRFRPIIAVSPTTRDALIEIGVARSQIRVIYNGVEQPKAGALVGDGSGRQVVYIGRLKRYKRLDRLVMAIGQLRADFPDIHLHIAGEGDARNEIAQLVESLNLQEHVTLHGFITQEEKESLLQTATVFATPSMQEGWGISVIEANAYGCPAVAYDVPGLSVAIRHEQTGLLANDDVSFVSALATMLRDEERRKRYSTAARLWSQHFDWDTSADIAAEMLYAAARRKGGADEDAAEFPLRGRPADSLVVTQVEASTKSLAS